MNTTIAKAWQFDNYPEHLHRVITEQGRGIKKEKKMGTVCAYHADDINQGMRFKVTFDDKSASVEISKADYLEGRLAYLAQHPESEDEDDEKVFRAASRVTIRKLTDDERARAREDKQVCHISQSSVMIDY